MDIETEASQRLKDAFEQLERYSNGVFDEKLLDIIDCVVEINDDLWHDRNPAHNVEQAKNILNDLNKQRDIKMETLADHNAKVKKEYVQSYIKNHENNGIKCPECVHILYDDPQTNILLTMPPQKKVFCINCNYSGYRFIK